MPAARPAAGSGSARARASPAARRKSSSQRAGPGRAGATDIRSARMDPTIPDDRSESPRSSSAKARSEPLTRISSPGTTTGNRGRTARTTHSGPCTADAVTRSRASCCPSRGAQPTSTVACHGPRPFGRSGVTGASSPPTTSRTATAAAPSPTTRDELAPEDPGRVRARSARAVVAPTMPAASPTAAQPAYAAASATISAPIASRPLRGSLTGRRRAVGPSRTWPAPGCRAREDRRRIRTDAPRATRRSGRRAPARCPAGRRVRLLSPG